MLKDSEIGNIAALGPVGDPPASKYERLIARAKQVPAARTVVGASRYHRSHPCRACHQDCRHRPRAPARH
jgi:hypothetical protein